MRPRRLRRGLLTFAATATVCAIAAAGCSKPAHDSAKTDPLPTTPVAEATSPAPSPTPSASPTQRPPEPITLAFGGDVHFEGMLRPKLAADPATTMGPIGKVLSAADVAMVNLETAVTTRGTAIPGKAYTFRAPATAFDALKAAGVDVTTMANNHGMDFGPVGLQDSLDAIRTSGFPTVGIGADAASAYAPWRVTVKGQRLAFISATQVLDGNLVKAWSATDAQPGLASAFNEERLLESVRAARADSDLVVVYLHWGQERNNCPIARQRDIAQKLIDAGADVLVGAHAHVLLGSGYLGKAYVNYGLGNFVWYAKGGASATTGVLTLTVEGRNVTKSHWTPAFITDGQPIPLQGAAADKAVAAWEGLRACTGLSATPQ